MERKSFVACEWINRRKYYPVIKRTRDVGWIWKALCLVIEYILKYVFQKFIDLRAIDFIYKTLVVWPVS